MNKYLFLLAAITLPNVSMAAASESGSDASSNTASSLFSLSDDGSVVSATSATSALERMKEQQEEQTSNLVELITNNIGSTHVSENARTAFNYINNILAKRGALDNTTSERAMNARDSIEHAGLNVMYYDNTSSTKGILIELAEKMKPGAKLLVICKKRMDSDTKLSTPERLDRQKTLKRFYGLPMAPQHQHIVLFEKR